MRAADAAGDGIVPADRVRAGAQGQPGAAAAGEHVARGAGARGPGRRPLRAGAGAAGGGGAAAGKRGVRMSPVATAAPLIPIARPFIGEEEFEAVRRPLTSGWLTQGPEVAAFEREFAAFVDAPHACAVSNCTTALHLALRAA